MSWQRLIIGSRMNREVHARFWERAEVKVRHAVRPARQTAEATCPCTSAVPQEADANSAPL